MIDFAPLNFARLRFESIGMCMIYLRKKILDILAFAYLDTWVLMNMCGQINFRHGKLRRYRKHATHCLYANLASSAANTAA
jgi:hypothetical protein